MEMINSKHFLDVSCETNGKISPTVYRHYRYTSAHDERNPNLRETYQDVCLGAELC